MIIAVAPVEIQHRTVYIPVPSGPAKVPEQPETPLPASSAPEKVAPSLTPVMVVQVPAAQPEVRLQPKQEEKTPEPAAKLATQTPEKVPEFIAKTIADHAQNGNKKPEDDAIKSAEKSGVPQPLVRQKKPLPILQGRAGRVHSDEEVDDILKTMLRDGKAPYGRARQQYNYKFHIRLADLADELIREGVPLHVTFRSKAFWRDWSTKTSTPIHASFYRKFA